MPNANDKFYLDQLLETHSPAFAVEEVKDILNKLYNLTGNLSLLESERDQNFCIITENGDQYIIKIANSAEDPAIIDMQIKTLEHIAKVDPELPVPEVLLSRNGLAIEEIQAADGSKHCVRILTYLQGAYPKDDPTEVALFRPIGVCLARLARALRGFFHPIANYEILWDLKHTSRLRQYLPCITNTKHQELATYFLDRFDQNVLPHLPKLRAQILHNDLTPDNILVAENDPGRIVGIMDFGDMTHTLLIIDLATTIAPMLRGHTDLSGVAAEIIAGYHEISPLEDAELRVLYDLVAARLTMLNVIAAWRVSLHPDNREYITGGVEEIWRTLEAWRALDPAAITRKFFRTCGLWEMDEVNSSPKKANETLQSHLKRRDHLLGPCAYLFYEKPLHIVRGDGVWLYDVYGNRYLDAYNNVSHVGHSHPHVVNAIAKQSRRLNTSTRYMHGLILELAEQITDRMPEQLSVCMFVCTGSEANELAWQMSKLVSGNSGALITDFAYHGSSAATMQFSPESIPNKNLPPYVQTLFAPTSDSTYQEPDSGISDAITALGEQDYLPAMLLLDTSFVSDGIYTSPKGYLETLFAKTSAAGGLCVADEVQGGFGRLGQHFWGFQFDNVVPDIVTMGKPMGNGHPLAAVVTRPEIAETLARETGYFNTFGGNPVSCAAGLAVLEVIEKEGLQRNALEVGQYLREELTVLQENYPVIGELHGSGLLQGINILKPDGTPDPELAVQIMNHMRENGVLIGTTGQPYSVLKIRPPIVFQKEDADILILALTRALDELINM
ncbi:MAG: aminotransferase class III-fold pyridoxal phosphate-dependent enzyme [Anaerolineales bacterium]|uniref:Aminotransferase class III-fold pyridoxal phosphate-dependent enzyme n=1 Tax=Candidatus Desulfolinea nitratireducens TaxID=2841698 RepID=A0A8J6TDZ8_9CHLR|nr:aminotransferase class III-fold pyridoxal phosphate-dependent enzyme [Candidatus Desulfolinea nitratireducens]MBL6960368.1 aminotransferase class III-fold pyridoxal phosphate-dependent enzyme [Anaerolineales bacterium]